MKVIYMNILENILKNKPCWTVTIEMGSSRSLDGCGSLTRHMFAIEKDGEVTELVKIFRNVADRMEKEDEAQNEKELLEYLKKNKEKEEEERKDNKFLKLTESIADQMEKLNQANIRPKYLIVGKAEYDILNWCQYQPYARWIHEPIGRANKECSFLFGLKIIPNLTVASQLTVTVDFGASQ